jgi:hypothetical protein
MWEPTLEPTVMMSSIAFHLSARSFKPRTRVPIPPSCSVAYYNSIPNRRRYFGSTGSPAALAKELAAQPTVLVFSPSPENLEEELDVELLQPHDIKIEITERTAEV